MTNIVLRQAREGRGWTQEHLAEEMSVGVTTVRSWERGIRSPSLRARVQLSEIFKKTPAELGLEVQLMEKTEEKPQMPSTVHSSLDENRRRMLQRVHSRWITGVLEHSLHHAALIALGLQEQPNAVENPWHLEVQESTLPARALPPGTHITHVYDDSGGALLILGEPGAGKTTLLLELARDLLSRAELAELQPIPVVFNLSTWAAKRQPLTDWLVEELNLKYHVPRKLGQCWVRDDQVLLLLDGLDEVASAHRQACVEAINIYRREHGLVPMVICSRRTEYLAQTRRIQLHNAVVVQPLTSQQIKAYLSNAGKPLEAVRVALQDDPQLQELATSPLMLSVLTLTYAGRGLQAAGLPTTRQQIFADYVERMLTRRKSNVRYTSQQTRHWLAWLARQLTLHNQTEFYLERLQPDWLSDEHTHHHYRNMIMRLVQGVEIAFTAVALPLFPGETRAWSPSIFTWLGGGFGSNLLGWMAPGLGGSVKGVSSLLLIVAFVQILLILIVGRGKIPQFSVQSILRSVIVGLRNGFLAGAAVGGCAILLLGARGMDRAIGIALFSAILMAVISGLLVLFQNTVLYSEDQLRRKQLPSGLTSVVDRLLNIMWIGVCATVGAGCVYVLQYGDISGPMLRDALLVGTFDGLALGMINGNAFHPDLGHKITPAEIVQWKWPTWRLLAKHGKKGVFLGGTIMISLMILFAGYSSAFYGIHYGLIYGLIYGSIVGFVTMTAGVLIGILTEGWSSGTLDERQFVRPNQGIHKSLSNALMAASLFGLIGGLLSGVIVGLAFALAGIAAWKVVAAGLAIVLGGAFLIEFFLLQGGSAFVEHYLLRWYLWRMNDLPWKYTQFLDYSVERILLQKVGGGYMFVHRLLLEYFANVSS